MNGINFLIGTFLVQLAHNGLIVVMPVILLRLTDSAAIFAFIASLFALLDTLGTLLGGLFLTALSVRNLIVIATVFRIGSILALALLESHERSSLLSVSVVFALDALFRGVADTCRHTVPLIMTNRSKSALQQFNASFQFFFECGGIVGPVLAGLMFYLFGMVEGILVFAALFMFAVLLYSTMPNRKRSRRAAPGYLGIHKVIQRDSWMKAAIAGQFFLTTYPLKAVIPGIIAVSLFQDVSLTAWLVAFFGTGGVIGSLAFKRLKARLSIRRCLMLSALGIIFFCVSWFSVSFWFISAAICFFEITNVIARLSLISLIQSTVTVKTYASVISSVRFTSNLASMILKFLIGLCFEVPSVMMGFGFASGLLFVFAYGQVSVGSRLLESSKTSQRV